MYIYVGVKEEIVQKSGAWFSYGDIRLGQGRENAKIYLKENPEIALDIENQIREKYNLPLAELVKENILNKTKDEKTNEIKDNKNDIVKADAKDIKK